MAIKRRGRPPKDRATEIIIKKKGRPKHSTEILEKRRTIKFADLHADKKKSNEEAHTHSDDEQKKLNHWYPNNKLKKDDDSPKKLKDLLGDNEITKIATPVIEDVVYETSTFLTSDNEEVEVCFSPNSPVIKKKEYVAKEFIKPTSYDQINKARNISNSSGTPLFTKETAPRSPGRPMGSRNKTTLALEMIGAENVAAVYAKMIALALAGDVTAGKIILDRAYPIRKGCKIVLEFDGPLDTIQDLNEASKYVTRMAFAGEITFEEADECGKAIERRMKVITDAVAMNRIEATIKRVELIKGAI